MAKHETVVWEPITLVVDYFECCDVDGVNTLVFEHNWDKVCVRIIIYVYIIMYN